MSHPLLDTMHIRFHAGKINVANQDTDMLFRRWEESSKPDSNPSSRLNHGPWSYEVPILLAAHHLANKVSVSQSSLNFRIKGFFFK